MHNVVGIIADLINENTNEGVDIILNASENRTINRTVHIVLYFFADKMFYALLPL